MNGLVIVANRLPVQVGASGELEPSPGGLVSAMKSVTDEGTQWIGWGGPATQGMLEMRIGELTAHPLTLTEQEESRYYAGFANSVLWPLFHGRLKREELNRTWWRTYRQVNERFAAAAVRVTPLGGTVWVHDYHLLLAPELIRQRRSDLKIGLFLHIPFPAVQLFATLPWRERLIDGMLGADLIGFQTHDDLRNFQAAAERLLGARVSGDHVQYEKRRVHTEVFPISVDFDHWDQLGRQVAQEASALRSEWRSDHVYLGVDRLDYSKGIIERLRAFGELLDEGWLDPARTMFVQVAVPSRTDIEAYREVRKAVEDIVDRVNTTHPRSDGTTPINYLDTSLDDRGLATHYRAADSLVVSSFADGMNLVAKEFVAARDDLDGTLILSEFAGAANDLPQALLINPFDIEAIKRAMREATEMPAEQRAERMTAMRETIRTHDVHRWAHDFLTRLDAVANKPGRRGFARFMPIHLPQLPKIRIVARDS
jgi:alpha,alpha-trehalose-phosphate synthase [UDP-forming]